jgi:SAM-dependent methyltransferase
MLAHKTPTLSDISSAYNNLFTEGNLRESDGFYRWILKCLAPSPPCNFLDVSCGEGHLLKWASNLRGINIWGVDISSIALEITHKNVPGAKLSCCDGAALPFPSNTFDYITNLGSLEHYINLHWGVRELSRVLKPNGRIGVFVPNSYYVADIIWHVWRTGYGPSHRQVMERFSTIGEWKDILTNGGIRVLRTYAYNYRFPASLSDWQWYWKRPTRFLHLLIAPLVPFNLSYSFLFIGEPIEQH